MMTTTRYYWILLVSLLLIFGCISESQQLVIKSINIPSAVKVGDVDYVILDCDYALENTSSQGLVVKWFFNDNRVIYQWIHGRNPLADEPVAKYIDLTYKASNDSLTQYRAMKLDKPGIDLTGDYMCVISTFEDERAANASMVIYTTEKKFDFEYQKKNIDNKDGLEAMCKAEGLYPQPTLDISVKDLPEKRTSKPTVTLRKDGLYNILSRVDFLDEELPEAAELKCILDIPRTNYSMTRKTIYYSVITVDLTIESAGALTSMLKLGVQYAQNMRRNVYAWVLCCAGTATTTSTVTTILQHKMENIQALDISKPSNGGGNFVDHASINLILLPILLAIFILFH